MGPGKQELARQLGQLAGHNEPVEERIAVEQSIAVGLSIAGTGGQQQGRQVRHIGSGEHTVVVGRRVGLESRLAVAVGQAVEWSAAHSSHTKLALSSLERQLEQPVHVQNKLEH